ncbi:MAG: Tex family protein [Pseudomonadota bacterium]
MDARHIAKIAGELAVRPEQVQAAAGLLNEGGTVPFIARYRKEATGSLDEVAVAEIRDRLEQLAELDKRRAAVLGSLEERGLLTDELKGKIQAAENMTTLEDVYLPFRPKRRTRAAAAREKGLEPLARQLFEQEDAVVPPDIALAFVDAEKGVDSVQDALSGARDIIAEWVNEHQDARARMRSLFENKGVFVSKVISGKEEEGSKFRDYFDWEEPVRGAPSHRVLAMRRGETEGVLYLRIRPPEDEALALLTSLFVAGSNLASQQVREAVEDCYNRLLSLSMETEVRLSSKKRADAEAIRIFAENLRELLLASPLGQKRVLALDPGFRTGCKTVCLDRQGKLLAIGTVYPHASDHARREAAEKIIELHNKFEIEAVAVGNGTAGRETEAFVKSLGLPGDPPIVMVNESGASIYSASEIARTEFPDLDLTFRGAVSIGRRLMDPLAELVKIDAKSIGVGQYQHDVNQPDLKRGLDDVVASCVNAVGVEVNTSSEQLLTYVSGLGPGLARNIVAFRNENGPFKTRAQLLKVPRLGPKAYEQAAGFLRIRDGVNPLDASAVHPESYQVVEKMARDLAASIQDLLTKDSLRKKIEPTKYVTDKIGLPTLGDIMSELAKPGRDPRRQFQAFGFAEGVQKIQDLEPGQRLPGVVTNVTAFGAFVDVGVHQDGLVHISQLSDRFVKDPAEVVKVHQQVMVTVIEVDLARNRISLSMKENPEPGQKTGSPQPRRPEKKADKKGQAPGPAPFNNPFAKAFKK